jgi:glycosyltransferase involved in cell wall biosynthesis
MPAILRQRSDAWLVVVGGPHPTEPDYPDQLRARAASLGIEGRVLFVGAQPDVPVWMQAADVLVHAADAEPFGLVVVEALALGKPVVVAAGGGPAEIVRPGEGEHVAFGDHDGLAAAILRSLDIGHDWAERATAARERAQQFSIEAFGERFSRAVLATDELPPVA